MSARAWAGFVAISVLWGIPYLFIKVAVDDGVPPACLAWARVVLGALVVGALAWRAGVLGSARPHLGWLALYAVIEICLPFPLIAAGEQRISSSLTAILVATVPTFVALLSLRFGREERLTGTRAAGLAIGFAGVVALVGIDVAGEPEELLGAGLVLFSSFCYAAGPLLLMLRFRALDPRATMSVALAFAAVALTPFALADTPARLTGDAALSLLVLGTLCTATAFVLFGALIAEVGAGRAAIITYVAPIVAVAAGVAVLDETLGPGAAAGFVLILGGSWLATRPVAIAPG